MTTLSNIVARDIETVLHPNTNLATLPQTGTLIIERGEGCWVTDNEGKRYLEGMAGLWCTSLGYGNEELVETAAAQIEAKVGPIYGVVLNAGITKDNLFPNITVEDWYAVIDTNLLAVKGSIWVTRPAMVHYATPRPHMLAMADELFGHVLAGRISGEPKQQFALAEAADAHRALESRRTTGATVLVP